MQTTVGQKGRLTRERLGYSMPPTSPLYPFPPMKLRNVEAITVVFETDPEAALQVLPEPLELREPATASIAVFFVPESSIGSYYEALYVLNASSAGRPIRYDVLSLLTGDQAMAFGREVLGVPKKLGHVRLEKRAEGIFGYAERPLGNRLLSIGVALEECMDISSGGGPSESAVSLRMIGQPEGSVPEVSMELIETPSSWELLEQWRGTGSVSFPSASQIDNWQILPVGRITGAFYSRYHIEIPVPRLLARI